MVLICNLLPAVCTDKMLGASRGYSVLNGLVYLIIGLAGLFPIVAALFPFE